MGFVMSVKVFDESPGSPYDRGATDAYYSDFPYPHKLEPTGDGMMRREVILTDPAELEAYYAGFNSLWPTDRKKYD